MIDALMSSLNRPIRIATRGSALALAQANLIRAQCRAALPQLEFELRILKTTGDKLQTASLAKEGQSLPKGLFTKELEVALLDRTADLAVHSLKDLPTELPAGLALGAVSARADVRDVLICRPRGGAPLAALRDLPEDAAVATSSTRRKAQLLACKPRLRVPDIRGNVLTRLQKLAADPELDGTILALAGLSRLGYLVTPEGVLTGEGVPNGLRAVVLELEEMLPCVGQGAIGIEIRQDDALPREICERLKDEDTLTAVVAERAFLAGMGGGCQSPVAAYARIHAGQVELRAVSFASGPVRHARGSRPVSQAAALGDSLARELKM